MAWSSASSLRAAPRQWQGHDISYDERASRDATAAPGRPERVGVWGPYRGPRAERASRDATAAPGRPERVGVWGPYRGPRAERAGRDATAAPGRPERAGERGPIRGAQIHPGGGVAPTGVHAIT